MTLHIHTCMTQTEHGCVRGMVRRAAGVKVVSNIHSVTVEKTKYTAR